MRKIKAALVGVGGWGGTHLVNWNRLAQEGLVEFAGVCDVNEANLAPARELGIPCFSSDTELYDTVQPDVVSISAGIPVHRVLLTNALTHGVSVLLEKPAAATADEVESMIFHAQMHPELFALIAFQFLYTPETRKLKELILSGKYGKLCAITVHGAVKRNDEYYRRNNWAGRIFGKNGQPIYDSPLSNAFAHYLNLGLFLAGTEPLTSAFAESVQNVQLLKARPEIENFDSCAFRAVTREGVPIDTFFTHTVTQPEWPHLKITLEQAKIEWDTTAWTLLAPDGTTVLERVPYQEDAQYHQFRTAALLAAGEPAPDLYCTLQTALEHTRCVEMIQKYPVTVLSPGEAIRREEEGGYYEVPDLYWRLNVR